MVGPCPPAAKPTNWSTARSMPCSGCLLLLAASAKVVQGDSMVETLRAELRRVTTFPSESAPALQFGVFKGFTLAHLLSAAFPTRALIGFDTFTGITKEAPDRHISDAWIPGGFSATSRAQPSIDVAMRDVARLVNRTDLTLVPGAYNESLTPALAAQIGVAAYIDIDCDTFLSSVQALDWAFAHGVARVGTIIGYDDWWCVARPLLWPRHGRCACSLSRVLEFPCVRCLMCAHTGRCHALHHAPDCRVHSKPLPQVTAARRTPIAKSADGTASPSSA